MKNKNEARKDFSKWTCRACDTCVETEWAQRPDGWTMIDPAAKPTFYLCASCWLLQEIKTPNKA